MLKVFKEKNSVITENNPCAQIDFNTHREYYSKELRDLSQYFSFIIHINKITDHIYAVLLFSGMHLSPFQIPFCI